MLIENQEGWFDAILRSDYALVQQSLPKFQGSMNPSGMTGLMYSSMRNDYRMVHILKQYEAGCRDQRGYTALMLAAEADNAEVCACLLDLEGDILLNDKYTAYNLAQWSHSYRAMKALAPYYGKVAGADLSMDTESSGELLFRIDTVADVREYNCEQVKNMVNELIEARFRLDSLQHAVTRQRDELKSLLNTNAILREAFIRQSNEMKQLETLLEPVMEGLSGAKLICSQRKEIEHLRLQIASVEIDRHIREHNTAISELQTSASATAAQSPNLSRLITENKSLRLAMEELQAQINHILLRNDPILMSKDEVSRVTLESEITVLKQELDLKNATISILTDTINKYKDKVDIECVSASTSMVDILPQEEAEVDTEDEGLGSKLDDGLPADVILTDENGNMQTVPLKEDQAIEVLFVQLEEKEKTILDLAARLAEQELLTENQTELIIRLNQKHSALLQSLSNIVSNATTSENDSLRPTLDTIAVLINDYPISVHAPSTTPAEDLHFNEIGIPSIRSKYSALPSISEIPISNITVTAIHNNLHEESAAMGSPFDSTINSAVRTPQRMYNTEVTGEDRHDANNNENDYVGLDLGNRPSITSPSIIIDDGVSSHKSANHSSLHNTACSEPLLAELREKIAEQERTISDQYLKIKDLEALSYASNTSETSKIIASLSLQLEEAKLSNLSIGDELKQSKTELATLEQQLKQEGKNATSDNKGVDNNELQSLMLELQQTKEENTELANLIQVLDAKLAKYESEKSNQSSDIVAELQELLNKKAQEVENLQELIPLLKVKDEQIIKLTEKIALNTQAEHDLLLANDALAQLTEKMKLITNQVSQVVDRSVEARPYKELEDLSLSDNSDSFGEQTASIVVAQSESAKPINILALTGVESHTEKVEREDEDLHTSSVINCLLKSQAESISSHSGVHTSAPQEDVSKSVLTVTGVVRSTIKESSTSLALSMTLSKMSQLEEMCTSLKNKNDELQDKLSLANEQIVSQIQVIADATAAADAVDEAPTNNMIQQLHDELEEKESLITKLRDEARRARDASDIVMKHRQDLQTRNEELQDELLDLEAQLVEARRAILQRANVSIMGTQTLEIEPVQLLEQSQPCDQSVQTLPRSSISVTTKGSVDHSTMNEPDFETPEHTVGSETGLDKCDTDSEPFNITILRAASRESSLKANASGMSLGELNQDSGDAVVTLSGAQYADLLQSIYDTVDDAISPDINAKSTHLQDTVKNSLALSKTVTESVQHYKDSDSISIPSSLIQTVQHLSMHMASIQTKLQQVGLLNRSLRHGLLENEAKRDMVESAETELSLQRKEIAYLREELAAKESHIERVTNLLKKAEDKIHANDVAVRHDRNKVHEINSEILQLKFEHSALQDEHQRAKLEVDSLKRRLEFEEARRQQVEKELANSNMELRASQFAHEELKKSTVQLTNENIALSALIVKTKTDGMEDQDSTLSSAVENLESEKHNLQEKLNRTVHSFVNLKSHMDETTMTLNKQVHEIEQQLVSAREKLTDYKESYEKLSVEHESALQRLDSVSQANKKLRMFIAEKKLDKQLVAHLSISRGETGYSNGLSDYQQKEIQEYPDDTPLMRAVLSRAPIAALRKQLRHVGCVRPDGTTALMLAAQIGNKVAVTLLREYESGVQRADGVTALDLAYQSGEDEICSLLLPFEKDRTTLLYRSRPR